MAKFAQNVTHPLNRTGDEEGARYENGEVFTPAGFKDAFRQYAEGGWIGLGADEEWGGQGMPKCLPFLPMKCYSRQIHLSCFTRFFQWVQVWL